MKQRELFDPEETDSSGSPELTDAELFQDGEADPEGGTVLIFKPQVLKLRRDRAKDGLDAV